LEQTVNICSSILKVDDKTVCVEFIKTGGDQFRFHEHFLEFKNNVLASMNDAVLAWERYDKQLKEYYKELT